MKIDIKKNLFLLLIITLLSGKYSLAGFHPELKSLGLLGEFRFWLLLILIVFFTGYFSKSGLAKITGRVMFYYFPLLLFFLYMIISGLWNGDIYSSLGTMYDLLFLIFIFFILTILLNELENTFNIVEYIFKFMLLIAVIYFFTGMFSGGFFDMRYMWFFFIIFVHYSGNKKILAADQDM